MGFKYFEGKNWAQITREERFFCERLFDLIKQEKVEVFAKFLSQELNLQLSEEGEWEIGYEVCFYRDFWQFKGRKETPYSPKRTFDLCLFGESEIVIIEAKSAGGFDSEQNKVFRRDIDEVKRLTKIQRVELVGLCSSKYTLDSDSESTFNGKVIR